jgi:hypothetical protein
MLFALLAQATPVPSGQFFLNGAPISSVTIERISWYGDCPGEETRSVSPVTFLSSTVQPAPYQRVLITNNATGGFTDREYDERRPQSQSFVVSLGQGQHGNFLSLAPGLNTFAWTVSNRVEKQQLGTGTAQLNVEVIQSQRARSYKSIKEDTYCLGERSKSARTSLDQCPDGYYTLERIGMCPNGSNKTLSLQTLRRGSGYQPYRPW